MVNSFPNVQYSVPAKPVGLVKVSYFQQALAFRFLITLRPTTHGTGLRKFQIWAIGSIQTEVLLVPTRQVELSAFT